MSDLAAYFRKAVNQRRIHILQLLIQKDKIKDAKARKKLDKQIQHEQEQIQAINKIWRMPC